MTDARLSPRVVAALDAARGLAAGYVVAHHVAQARHWADHGIGMALRFGQEAVLVFFLLSGFVIFANERRRALAPAGYYRRRVRRIYPVLVAAMGVSTLVALDDGRLARDFSPGGLVGTLAGLQDVAALKPGVIVDPYLGNMPLWSLSYELAFYAAFPLALAAWTRWPRATRHGVGLCACLAYALYVAVPGHFLLVGAYFLVWWAGAMAAGAWQAGARDARAVAIELGWLAGLCGVAAAAVAIVGWRGIGFYPALPLRHFLAAAVLLALLYAPAGRWLARRIAPWARPAAALASVSYGLYVLHYPLLVQWHRAQGPAGLAAALAVLVLLAWAVERRLPRLIPGRPRAVLPQGA